MPRPDPDEVYRAATRVFSAIILGFGVAIVAITLGRGGGPGAVGLWIGLIFTALGAGRLYLAVRR